MKIAIRNQFRKYLNKLGFSDAQIDSAWKKTMKESNSADFTINELVCRDILRGESN